MERKTTQLKRLLGSSGIEFLMEAHSGLSARIAEEAGFKGIWGSGLSISASLGVRDCNEASWTQVLEVVEFMSDATAVPILLDADTGYGDFNQVRRLVRKLEQRGVAGMCIEDKLFPKRNSLLPGALQPLAGIGEFAGKIEAAKDTQSDGDFCVVARVEALIAGRGLDEALERGHAYRAAGADAILIHSKQPTAEEILAFARSWGSDCPLAVAPTTYAHTPVEVLEAAGIGLVIWANHLLRSSIGAMQRTAEKLLRFRSITAVEDEIAPLSEVFRLQDVAELDAAERRYLRPSDEYRATGADEPWERAVKT